MKDRFIEDLIEQVKKQSGDRDPLELKKHLINKIIETYFAIAPENMSEGLRYDFMVWLNNGDQKEAKDEAMFRCFRQYCEEPEDEDGAATPQPPKVN